MDRSNWPSGPWDSEPDEKAWVDPETGLACVINRVSHSGHLCGYVGVPLLHALYKFDYNQRIPWDRESVRYNDNPLSFLCEALADDDGCASLGVILECHGGVTFAGKVEEWSPDLWWFGFDCNHCDDQSPTRLWSGNYRDFAFVEREVTRLAKQLASFGETRV